jgi:hypothetical protein
MSIKPTTKFAVCKLITQSIFGCGRSCFHFNIQKWNKNIGNKPGSYTYWSYEVPTLFLTRSTQKATNNYHYRRKICNYFCTYFKYSISNLRKSSWEKRNHFAAQSQHKLTHKQLLYKHRLPERSSAASAIALNAMMQYFLLTAIIGLYITEDTLTLRKYPTRTFSFGYYQSPVSTTRRYNYSSEAPILYFSTHFGCTLLH